MTFLLVTGDCEKAPVAESPRLGVTAGPSWTETFFWSWDSGVVPSGVLSGLVAPSGSPPREGTPLPSVQNTPVETRVPGPTSAETLLPAL